MTSSSSASPALKPYTPPPQTSENCNIPIYSDIQQCHENKANLVLSVDWADLEGLDISLLDQLGGIEVLAEQVLKFINTNGMDFYFKTAS